MLTAVQKHLNIVRTSGTSSPFSSEHILDIFRLALGAWFDHRDRDHLSAISRLAAALTLLVPPFSSGINYLRVYAFLDPARQHFTKGAPYRLARRLRH